MKCFRLAAVVVVVVIICAATVHVRAQDDQATREVDERTEEINIGLDLNDVVRLEAAVKKVEDELRGREFIIQAQKASDQVVKDLDEAIVNLQSQKDRAADLLLRDANDVARFRMKLDGQKEKGPFLGISGSAVTGPLREHLKLPRGVGLLVEHVQPKSAAELAGVKRFDVLHKLGDQLIINPHQLAVLVRTHKPGDDVKLTVIRAGESKELTAKLTEAELEPLDDENVWGARPLWREKLERAIEPENQVRLARPQLGKRGVLTRVREKDGTEKVVAVDDEHTLIVVKKDEAH